METKYRWSLIFMVWVSTMGYSQTAFDDKLNSLYRYTVKTITATELKTWKKNEKKFILLDTRSPEEFQVSHIQGSQLLDYNLYGEKDLRKLPLNSIIVVYCSVGYRSERVGEKLQRLGYTRVWNLYGGIFQWKNEGGEVVNPSGLATDSVHTYNRNWSKWLIRGIKVYK
jgi:rhodanese-related sulfurtransferase